MKVTIHPAAIGFRELQMEYNGFGDPLTMLHQAVEQFAAGVGLVAINPQGKLDLEAPYVEFTLGTGRKFIAFETLEG